MAVVVCVNVMKLHSVCILIFVMVRTAEFHLLPNRYFFRFFLFFRRRVLNFPGNDRERSLVREKNLLARL